MHDKCYVTYAVEGCADGRLFSDPIYGMILYDLPTTVCQAG
jgi:hypothetical protein